MGAGRARIIPAYAGSTGSSDPGGLRRGDHPRIRGEHGAEEALDRDASGSSPHTRGARTDEWVDAGPARIIPAYAGSTQSFGYPQATQKDHPRIRGEHAAGLPADFVKLGSSPHTRGALVAVGRLRSASRIIPAYAGSTDLEQYAVRAEPDHPRIRGEHFTIEWEVKPGRGSSPHTRGARQTGPEHGVRKRIIPAYAGSTRYRVRPSSRMKDHPRIRGEHLNRIKQEMPAEGSSPHTRGAHWG